MRLFSQQRVRFGFTLFFLAFTQEDPPNEDPTAVENREWLYQRKFSQIELQHFDGDPDIWLPSDAAAGFDSVTFCVALERIELLELRARENGIAVDRTGDEIEMKDPDGRRIIFVTSTL